MALIRPTERHEAATERAQLPRSGYRNNTQHGKAICLAYGAGARAAYAKALADLETRGLIEVDDDGTIKRGE